MASDRDRLGLFLSRVDRLTHCRYVSQPTPARWSLKWERGKQLMPTMTQPSEEVIKSFLVDFRPFVSKQDPVYLYAIFGICERRLPDSDLKSWLRMSRQYWKEAHRESGVRLRVRGRNYQPEEIADLWINGWYFHTDQDKLERLQELGKAGMQLDRIEFLHFLDRALQQILYTGVVVKAALKDSLFRFE